jgi:hypothetical protein
MNILNLSREDVAKKLLIGWTPCYYEHSCERCIHFMIGGYDDYGIPQNKCCVDKVKIRERKQS